MSNFDKIYERLLSSALSNNRGEISPRLEPLLRRFYEEAIRRPADLRTIKVSLVDIFTFLTTPEGRTDANCWAVDNFVCIDDHWERDLSDLPQSFVDVIADVGGALHDTISSPNIARNFDATPEQLLERAQKLRA